MAMEELYTAQNSSLTIRYTVQDISFWGEGEVRSYLFAEKSFFFFFFFFAAHIPIQYEYFLSKSIWPIDGNPNRYYHSKSQLNWE